MPVLESQFGRHIIVRGSRRIHDLDVNERERAGCVEIGDYQIGDLEEEGTFASAKGSHLPMRAWAVGDEAYLAALKYEAKFISNPVIDSTMETEPLTAAYKVARIGSKRL